MKRVKTLKDKRYHAACVRVVKWIFRADTRVVSAGDKMGCSVMWHNTQTGEKGRVDIPHHLYLELNRARKEYYDAKRALNLRKGKAS